jgi:hypothetical protein
MKIYELPLDFFYSVKTKLDGLVFWRESMHNTVYIKLAAPQHGLVDFMKKFSINVLKSEDMKLKPLIKQHE